MTPLAMPHPGAVLGGTLFFAAGVWSIFLGLRLRYGPIPYFVSDYSGWTSVSLALPFGGVFILGGGVSIIGSQVPAWTNMVSQIPIWVDRTVAIPLFFSLVIGLSGFFVRFPKSLTPRWYRRALKAGIPRNDPYVMGKFKALDIKTQKALIKLHKDHETSTKQKTRKRWRPWT